MSRQMKDSGIPWIGQVPEMWTVAPIRSVIKEITTKNILGKETTALQFRYGTIVEKANFEAEGDDYVARTIRNYTIIYPGVLVLNGLNLNYDFVTKRVALSRLKGVITSAYMTIMPIDTHALLPEFLEYLFKCYDAKMAFHGMGEGVRKILNFNELKHQPIIYPSHDEQKQIVAVLDKKCTEVEGLSSNIQKQIEALEQYKRAVITETVTKGLNPSVLMKDSGIPWIGQIPAHWSTIKIKFLASFYNGYAFDSESLTDEGDGTVIRIGDICEGSIKPETALKYNGPTLTLKPYQIEKGDILIALSGATVGKTGYITKDYPNAFINQRVGIIRSTNSRFLNHALQTSSFIPFALLHAAASAQPNISLDTIGNYTIAFPNNSREQQAIAEYLDKKCAKIDGIIQAKQQQLEELEQYKKAIIFEYVTGKKQVPEA